MTVSESARVEHRLWTDASCFAARRRKSASALVAVQQAIERHRLLKGREREFLNLYTFVAAAPTHVFSEVWADPRAYWWVRVAYELVKASISGSELSPLAQRTIATVRLADPRAGLDWHLEQFKLFALAVALRAGRDIRFARSWEPCLPVAIPASHVSLSGPGSLLVHGLMGRRLLATTVSGRDLQVPLDETIPFESGEIARQACPCIEHKGCRVWAHPHAFHVPGVQDVTEVLEAGVDFQWRHSAQMHQTLSTMERYDPVSFEEFRRTIRLIALKPRDCGNTFNTTHSQLPGAFTASAVDNPLALSDDFIHELHHNRLFALEEAGPFFDASACDAFTDARFYSPWRYDPRPLHGLLHGLYVFTRVTRYWLAVWRDRDLSGADRAYALDRLLRLPRQLAMAAGVLQRRATFSPRGQMLFADLCFELHRLQDDLASQCLPADGPALALQPDGSYAAQRSELHGGPLSVCQAVDEHCRLYDLAGDCDEWVAEPLPTAA